MSALMMRGVALLLLLSAIFTGYHLATEHYREQGRVEVRASWNADKLIRAQALQKITDQLRQSEQEFASQLSKAQNDFTEKTTQINADADRARVTANSLRNDLATVRTRLSAASTDSRGIVTEYANAVTDVFEQCTEQYRDVAEKADRHAADAKMMWSAWPQVQTPAQ